jgi:hypothetical protein
MRGERREMEDMRREEINHLVDGLWIGIGDYFQHLYVPISILIFSLCKF